MISAYTGEAYCIQHTVHGSVYAAAYSSHMVARASDGQGHKERAGTVADAEKQPDKRFTSFVM